MFSDNDDLIAIWWNEYDALTTRLEFDIGI